MLVAAWGTITFAPSMFGARAEGLVLCTRMSVAVLPFLRCIWCTFCRTPTFSVLLCLSMTLRLCFILFLHQFAATKTTENVSLVYHSPLYSSNPAAGCKTRTSYLVVASWRRATQEVDRQVLSGCKISALLTPTIHTVIPMRYVRVCKIEHHVLTIHGRP